MVPVSEFVKGLGLEIISPGMGLNLAIENSDINRPGIQLADYWVHFAYERPQILGKVEMSYLASLDAQTRRERLQKFFSYSIPCVVVCHNMPLVDGLAEAALNSGVPLFSSHEDTTQMVLRIINYLNNYLAPRITQHGVLVDVFGSGLLITGESGVGKSEAALELVKRGHRLVADDVVDIRRVSSDRLVGEAPEMIRYFMEIRGVGIIDIATMYGIGSVIRSKSIDLVIHMELWQADKEYDRLGLEECFTQILGVKLPRIVLPIRPGRNLAIVLEVAARNQRLKQNGFNAARTLNERQIELMRCAMSESGDEG
jgi:HPr kinase/phosphorylase